MFVSHIPKYNQAFWHWSHDGHSIKFLPLTSGFGSRYRKTPEEKLRNWPEDRICVVFEVSWSLLYSWSIVQVNVIIWNLNYYTLHLTYKTSIYSQVIFNSFTQTSPVFPANHKENTLCTQIYYKLNRCVTKRSENYAIRKSLCTVCLQKTQCCYERVSSVVWIRKFETWAV